MYQKNLFLIFISIAYIMAKYKFIYPYFIYHDNFHMMNDYSRAEYL